jgi:hypothetical protein
MGVKRKFSVQRSAFSVQRSAFSGQRSAVSGRRAAFSVRRRSLAPGPTVSSAEVLQSCSISASKQRCFFPAWTLQRSHHPRSELGLGSHLHHRPEEILPLLEIFLAPNPRHKKPGLNIHLRCLMRISDPFKLTPTWFALRF